MAHMHMLVRLGVHPDPAKDLLLPVKRQRIHKLGSEHVRRQGRRGYALGNDLLGYILNYHCFDSLLPWYPPRQIPWHDQLILNRCGLTDAYD